MTYSLSCSLYNQTPLLAGSNPKGTQRNKIWQLDVFHLILFVKLKYVHHTIDTYSGFQWVAALSSEEADFIITYIISNLLVGIAIMGIQMKHNQISQQNITHITVNYGLRKCLTNYF